MLALESVNKAITPLTAEREELLRHIEDLAAGALEGRRELTTAEAKEVRDARSQLGRIETRLEELDERREELLEIQRRTVERAKRPSLNFGPVNGPDHYTGGSDYERARRNVDYAVRSGHLPDHGAERVTGLLEGGTPAGRSQAARWAAAAGDPHYRTAFAKLAADPERGHLMWTAEEGAAFRSAAELTAEARAMSTGAGGGGEMIPFSLDPAILLTNDGSANPLRRLARVVQTTSNAWTGVTSAGVTAEWKTEAAQAADASPTLAAPTIPVHLGDAFVPYSFEVGQDAEGFLDELTKVLLDSAEQLQATAFTTGSGTGEPQGIVTGLVGTASEINGSGVEALDDSDPFRLQNDLGARFSDNAVFLSHIATANIYRQMETTNGALFFPELRQTPPMLCGKSWFELSNMDATINPAATANNYMMVYGDVRAGFVIVDRIGSTLELIPNLVGANQRPTGQRGALLWFRCGSEVVVPEALRLLDVPTTA